MLDKTHITVDGNEAVAIIAHQTNDVLAIYPITPASPMGEWADAYTARGQKNLWETIPAVVEMQSEAGAAGTLHGAIQGGAVCATFTSSQGLLLMIPNLYKIAGELTPAVIHVAARSIATHALSIFCDHSDVMACRATGAGMWFSNSVQEAHDGALISQMLSFKSRIPFLHVFDGFRTSHEVSKIESIAPDELNKLFPWQEATEHRSRAMTPDSPVIRGTSQNPDLFFQSRERINPIYEDFEDIANECLKQFGDTTGRCYTPYEYFGSESAEKVIILMGSGVETAKETIASLNSEGLSVGVVSIRLFRPFLPTAFSTCLPETARHIAVLDRTKEPGATAEPLFQDVLTALHKTNRSDITLSHGRFGLSSKEFTPGMIKGLFDAMDEKPLNGFTLGITDDLSNSSIPYSDKYRNGLKMAQHQAVFYGLGADGTVSANKNSIKILGEQGSGYVQGYFEYDSKKSGAVTISHLRFSDCPIQSSYLIESDSADFIACHQFNLLDKYSILDKANKGATFLINAPFSSDKVWQNIPSHLQKIIIQKELKVFTIDAYRLAKELGLNKRINTIMQSCFFAISNFLPKETAIELMQDYASKTYKKAGKAVIKANHHAIRMAVEHLTEIAPATTSTVEAIKLKDIEFKTASDNRLLDQEFLNEVILPAMKGEGNRIPVSQLPLDGTYPTGTAKLEKRNISPTNPEWETDLCTQCGKCVFVCPHSVIRSKLIADDYTKNAPKTFKQVPTKSKAYGSGWHISYQVSPEDCTGCELCVEVCPIRDKTQPDRKALNMVEKSPILENEKVNWQHFVQLPETEHHQVKLSTIPGSSLCDPLFEFSGACSGCGETPYINLVTRLFGDRMLIGNATGCSSIYGGNLPTTPYSQNKEGRGPAWNNSLFEDNAEFTLGLRYAADQLRLQAEHLLKMLSSKLPETLATQLLSNSQNTEEDIYEQRTLVKQLVSALNKIKTKPAKELTNLADYLVHKSVWGIGGDGWAYDIGFGGLDHVLASGKNVNLLVLDTEVYSNTGGQMSKATPLGAIAKFAAGGRPRPKKDLAAHAMAYEDVYVAQIAFGAKDTQTLKAIIEAEKYPGTSLIIAYSPCIAHGIDLKNNLRQQALAVNSGHWPLLRYNPEKLKPGTNPLKLDYKKPIVPYSDYMETEARFSVLKRTQPVAAAQLGKQAQALALHRYYHLKALASLSTDNSNQREET